MFNSSLEAYGAVKRPAAPQNAAGAPGAVDKLASVAVGVKSVENKPPVEVDKASLNAAVKKLNELVAPTLQNIEFSMDQESDRMVVKVVDTSTQKVLRQIPNEEVLAFSKTLGRLQGLVIRQTA
ncbi:MAG: flagellar protein FlaG [Methylotenera sp.]|nr:flagellar protein FlaG [Methylotenera sp.]MDO9232902.1 flagellar protein FlaG [Methylotenera sp.]MDP2101899.1 flagellar protein FlaG [Methylotenera sp.]MDP2281378.1 flagellar protein FlaG [Methylotenera sp.]MDP2402688.1 flagellar protein FlaG [Methylotenera sp.]